MAMVMKALILAVAVSLLFIPQGAYCCLQNLPRYQNQGRQEAPRLPDGIQTLIPDYYFSCYGNVTHWGVYVEPPRESDIYMIEFQVWRLSEETGCYTQVGSNQISQGSPKNAQFKISLQKPDQIQVEPGDVVGFYVNHLNTQNGGGVEYDKTVTNVTVWYTRGEVDLTGCGIKTGERGHLDSSIQGAPVISAAVATSTESSPDDVIPPTTQSVLKASPTKLREEVRATSKSPPDDIIPPTTQPALKASPTKLQEEGMSTVLPNEMVTSEGGSAVNTIILGAVGMALVLAATAVLVASIAGCVLCHRRGIVTKPKAIKHTATGMQMKENESYTLRNESIPLAKNMAYMASTEAIHTMQTFNMAELDPDAGYVINQLVYEDRPLPPPPPVAMDTSTADHTYESMYDVVRVQPTRDYHEYTVIV